MNLRHVVQCGGLCLFLLATTGCSPDASSRPASELPETASSLAESEDHSELIEKLESLRQAGKYDEGLSIVRRQLELSPKAALLHFQLGLFLQSTGELEAAEVAARRALELQPAHYPSYRALGDLARLQGAPAEAAEHYRACVDGLPDHAGCRFGLGLALVDLGELDAAAESLRPAAEQLDRADAWSELGQLERRRGQLEASVTAFSRALAHDRNHLPTLLGMGQTLVASGRRDEGQALLERHREEAARQDEIDALSRASKASDAPMQTFFELARQYRARDELQAVEATLRQVLERSPGFPAAMLGLANHLKHHGDAAEADRLVDELMPQMAENSAVLFLQGTIDLALGDASAAQTHFDASLAQGTWPPTVYVDAGKAWNAAGFPEQAASAFQKALAGLPESADAHLGLAQSQRALGATQQALASAERAAQLDASGTAWWLVGVLRTDLADPEAIQAFTAGLDARQLDLLPADGAEALRRELEALDPSEQALELFDQALTRTRS